MTIIEPQDWIAQPWRNGAGTTHELVRVPLGAEFALRVSVAEITRPAPFSSFAGYRRHLYLLDGGPVTLTIDGHATTLTAVADGLAFAGEASVAATEVARASRDLNVMAHPSITADVRLHRGATQLVLAGDHVVVFVLEGSAMVEGHRLGRHACAWMHGQISLDASGIVATVAMT